MPDAVNYRVGILTISDRAFTGDYADQSGPVLRKLVEERLNWPIAEAAVVPDDRLEIRERLRQWVDVLDLGLILTTGGTGFAPRDVTPEATRDVIEREAPGLAEAMRATSLAITPHAMLSRIVCGIRGRTLILNLPGSPRAAQENLDAVLPVLPHALDLLRATPGAESGHTRLHHA
ncbi:MAG: MogA/MoaB family molybdenum cofactor biosynthesis protein [Anaerolineae bacterium]|nr:MogA/MoaB family molybdenum cofactor biosynthesis protein [Anaerolineae bacterium]